MKGAIREPQPLPLAEPRVQMLEDEPIRRPARWTALAAVGAVLVAGWLLVASIADDPGETVTSAPAVAAGGMAGTAVAAYLAGTEMDAGAMFGSVATKRHSYYVVSAHTVLLDEHLDRWEAIVAVDLLSREGDAFRPAGIHYYQIRLKPTQDGWQVLSAPALVAAPVVTAPDISWDAAADEAAAHLVVDRLQELAISATALRTATMQGGTLVEVEALVGGQIQILVYEVRADRGRLVVSGVG